jgi:hypothetical protein
MRQIRRVEEGSDCRLFCAPVEAGLPSSAGHQLLMAKTWPSSSPRSRVSTSTLSGPSWNARNTGKALAFYHADTVPLSYWRKRKNVPPKPASVDALSIRQLEQNLSNYFHKMQGRGENCKVDCYNRNDLDYFFAYPEDYAQAKVEWVGKEFKRRPHHPAFEIIFVYSQNDGTLDIYLTGDRKPVPDLQGIFAGTILKAELGPDKKDERVYDLNPVRSWQFRFVYDPESGIATWP